MQDFYRYHGLGNVKRLWIIKFIVFTFLLGFYGPFNIASISLWQTTLQAQSIFPISIWKPASQADAQVTLDGRSKDIDKLRQAALYYYYKAGSLYNKNRNKSTAELRALADHSLRLIKRAYRLDKRNPQTLLLYGLISNAYIGFYHKDGNLNLDVAIQYSAVSKASFSKLRQLEPDNVEVIACLLLSQINIPPNTEAGINKRLQQQAQAFHKLIAKSKEQANTAYMQILQDAVYIVQAELARRSKDEEKTEKYLAMAKRPLTNKHSEIMGYVYDSLAKLPQQRMEDSLN